MHVRSKKIHKQGLQHTSEYTSAHINDMEVLPSSIFSAAGSNAKLKVDWLHLDDPRQKPPPKLAKPSGHPSKS